MQGRAHDGLAFLAETETVWAEGTALSLHLAWHRALFYLEASDFKSALATYDALIAMQVLLTYLRSPTVRRCYGGSNSKTSM
jgi:hypothetical protein